MARRIAYSKAGLITDDLVPLDSSQRVFLGIGQRDRANSEALMSAMGAHNKRLGRGTVHLAADGFERSRTWSTKFDMRSPPYTTRPNELMAVTA